MDPEEMGPVLQQLSAQATQALEEAVAAAQRRGHGFVGVEHLAWSILQLGETTQRIQESGIDPGVVRLASEQCLGAVFRIPSEPNAVPDCTPRVFSVLKNRAPAVACRRGHLRVEPDDLLIAVLQEEATPLVEALRERGVDAADLVNRLCKRVQPRFEIPSGIQPWCHDLTAQAERGELLLLVGREKELHQIVRILTIPKGVGPSNPLVVGPAGVGKTALIEGLAQRIAKGEEPRLRDVRIIQVNMNVMQENTVFRGQFEARLQQTIEFAKGPPSGGRVVLFLDEMHLIVGAGRAIGAPADAAQILLQPLGRGEVQIIGATTIEQYERHLSDDDAVVRRFSTVEVDEPSLDETRTILQGIRTELEARFQASGDEVRVTDEAIEAAVRFAPRYLLSQRLPHKPRQWVVDAMVHCARAGRSEVLPNDVGAVVAEATGIPPEILFRSTQWSPEHW